MSELTEQEAAEVLRRADELAEGSWMNVIAITIMR